MGDFGSLRFASYDAVLYRSLALKLRQKPRDRSFSPIPDE
jgi:hypothetical protein